MFFAAHSIFTRDDAVRGARVLVPYIVLVFSCLFALFFVICMLFLVADILVVAVEGNACLLPS